ncbi:MAG: sigma-70 family RNA polymerase sigma factor [Acidobacteria bacterium]|nr:sigma-70 family RNA polymerase sigma factor [Acidobacteriota bacterium]
MSSTGQAAGGKRAWQPSALDQTLFAELYRRSGAQKFGTTEPEFGALLAEIGGKYLDADVSPARVTEMFDGLHVEELALARACAAGSETAWEVFLTRYREKLYDAARGITREDTSAHELADSLYADLYGTTRYDGRSNSKLLYYTGRGSLEGFLRVTLAQEHVNHIRRQHRTVSLDEKLEAGEQFGATDPEPQNAPDPRLSQAAGEALASLSPEESFILASYHLDGRTLAEIARMLGVHESTISRRVEKITGAVRKSIVGGLKRRGMSARESEEALSADVRDVSIDVRARLQGKHEISFSKEKGS